MLVLANSLFNDSGVTQLRIDFRSGKHRIYLPAHEMCIDEIKHTGLRLFYCFTGCDQVSFLANVSKKTAGKICDVFPNVNKAFATMNKNPTDNDIHEQCQS